MRQSSANRYIKTGEEIKDTKKDSQFLSEKEYKNDCKYAILYCQRRLLWNLF